MGRKLHCFDNNTLFLVRCNNQDILLNFVNIHFGQSIDTSSCFFDASSVGGCKCPAQLQRWCVVHRTTSWFRSNDNSKSQKNDRQIAYSKQKLNRWLDPSVSSAISKSIFCGSRVPQIRKNQNPQKFHATEYAFNMQNSLSFFLICFNIKQQNVYFGKLFQLSKVNRCLCA